MTDQPVEFCGFPGDLAEQISRIWPTLGSKAYSPPVLPSDRQLRFLLETAFLASIETDESNKAIFMLCCTPSDERAYPGRETTTDTIVFEKPRPFNIQEIRRLAAAISNDSCMIWVCFPEPSNTRPLIYGLVNNQALPNQPPDFFPTPAQPPPAHYWFR